ncbi:MAG: hypothetical protein IRZ28_13245 [Steroidobacteraceae bacterium]|nr:hypothetical protein [Steroidobacteraceae bacterium]
MHANTPNVQIPAEALEEIVCALRAAHHATSTAIAALRYQDVEIDASVAATLEEAVENYLNREWQKLASLLPKDSELHVEPGVVANIDEHLRSFVERVAIPASVAAQS